MKYLPLSFLLLALLSFHSVEHAHAEVRPEQVAVIVNKESPESMRIAQHYQVLRQIPAGNLITISTKTDETISREDYEKNIVAPVRKFLVDQKLGSTVRVLVTTYGVPLRVLAPEPSNDEKEDLLAALSHQKAARAIIRKGIEFGAQLAPVSDKPIKLPPASADQTPEQDRALLLLAEQTLKESATRINKISDLEKKKQAIKQITAVVSQIGGFSSLVQHLKPSEGSAAQHANEVLQKMRSDFENGRRMLMYLEATPSSVNRKRSYFLTERLFGAAGVLSRSVAEISALKYIEADASVDSELSVLWWDRHTYRISGKLPNPLYRTSDPKTEGPRVVLPILMVSRLDAPSADLAFRLADSALSAERNGLKGNAFFDTRGRKYDPKDVYAIWDQSISDIGWLFRKKTSLGTTIDKYEPLLENAPNTAVYAGWYQLRDFKNVFSFTPGAIAYHIASEEAVSLHAAGEKGWCKGLLEHGAAVTLGAIAEPYLDSFPDPLEFFGLLLSGKYSLVEAYYLTSRYLSWRMLLIGDPLYNPWRGKNLVAVSDLQGSVERPNTMKDFPASPSERSFDDPAVILAQVQQKRETLRREIDAYFDNLEKQAKAAGDVAKEPKKSPSPTPKSNTKAAAKKNPSSAKKSSAKKK